MAVDALGLAITNTGKRRGIEVVQRYAADTATRVTLPAQQRIGFERIDLEPGTSKPRDVQRADEGARLHRDLRPFPEAPPHQ